MGSLFSGLLKETNKPGPGKAKASAAASEAKVVIIRTIEAWNANLESHKQSGRLMVIDFKATWCGPCGLMEPVVKQLSARFTSVDFVQVDVDELREVAMQWNVEALPTFILVRGGNEVKRIVGAMQEDLLTAIEQSTAVAAPAPTKV